KTVTMTPRRFARNVDLERLKNSFGAQSFSAVLLGQSPRSGEQYWQAHPKRRESCWYIRGSRDSGLSDVYKLELPLHIALTWNQFPMELVVLLASRAFLRAL